MEGQILFQNAIMCCIYKCSTCKEHITLEKDFMEFYIDRKSPKLGGKCPNCRNLIKYSFLWRSSYIKGELVES